MVREQIAVQYRCTLTIEYIVLASRAGLITNNQMIEIQDSVQFSDKYENYLKDNCTGQFTYEQRVIASRALMEMIDEMDND